MASNLFAFDIGTNSIGWAVLALDNKGEPESIVDIGSHIFADGRDPKSKASLAVARRDARSMSRNRDRYKRRRKAILRTLIEYGLMPAQHEAQKALLAETGDRKNGSGEDSANPYALRARALDEALPPAYLGRALFHLSQRRGFKSNRKTDRRDNDKGKIALGIDDLKQAMVMDGARTYGEWLAMRRERGQVVRLRADSDAMGEEGYSYYPERALLEAEFRAIWQAQAVHHPDLLNGERGDHLARVIFYQRPLKRPLVGKCSFNPEETRIAKAHPLFQQFRLYKEVNELELILPDHTEQKLTPEQRDILILHLRSKKKVTYKALRNSLKLSPDISFNKETDSRKDMLGDEVHAAMGDKKRFGPLWGGFDLARQWQIIERLKEEEDPVALFAWLEQDFAIIGEQAEAIANCPLPEGHGRLGETALSSMLDELMHSTEEGYVIPERTAAENCGYNPSSLGYEGEGEVCLPPYQEILERHIPPGTGDPDDIYDIQKGRITNPTVHIGLNQLRRLVNGLIKRHGKPELMALELARDLQLSDKQKDKIRKQINQNTKQAEARSAKIRELQKKYPHIQDNGYNRLLLKLWEELNPDKPEDRCCIYSGRPINIERLFSSDVHIDHILPWSQTLDDSQGNKILCLETANRQKRNRAPADVTEWHGQTYEDILARSSRLPKNKRWRFAADAMARFEADGGFLARQLTDTQYLSRLAREYLDCLYPSEEPDAHGVLAKRNHVIVSSGRLTEMLRRNWGLNNILPDHNLGEMAQSKNRKDHRHHAIDAAVVGVTTRSLLQRISRKAGLHDGQDLQNQVTRMVADTPPWEGFREDLQRAVNGIIVSHKPDHGTLSHKGYASGKGQTAGQLHNDTAYGMGTDRQGRPVAIHRKPFLSLTAKDIPSIRDEQLQAELYDAIGHITDKKALQAALRDFKQRHRQFAGIRRVRIEERLRLIEIKDRQGKPYKGYKGDANHRYDVWETLDGKWHHEVVSMYDAHQPGWQSSIHQQYPTARRVLRLQQNDMVAYDHPVDGFVIARVVKFSQNGQIFFAEHKESGSLKARNADKEDPFKYFSKSAQGLQKIGCRQVRIDATGRLFDPGPQDRAARNARKAGKTG